ncbi:MAG: zinc-dependent alcohol dehydrogenase [Anaerolineae bacterium]
MKAAVIEKPMVVALHDVPVPEVQAPDQVQIRVVVTGICGSEIHAYHGTHPFRIPPVISGHELAGVVTAIGEAVTTVRAGDRVTVEPHYGCGVCRACREGAYNACASKQVLGTQSWPGSFGEFIVVPEKTVVPLPNNVTDEQGALIEPIAVGVHAVRKAGVGLGDRVAILGAGPIGLGLLLAARAAGAAMTFVTDISAHNREVALKMGATHALDPREGDTASVMVSETGGEGVDVVFLGVAVESVLNEALRAVRRRGTVSEVGMFSQPPRIDIHLVQNKELKILGSNMYTREDFTISAEAIAGGRFDTSHMISKTMPMDSVVEAMDLVDRRLEDVVKVLLRF